MTDHSSENVGDPLFGLPKAELHVHLDGSLRPETLLDLAVERGVTLPAGDPRALAAFMVPRVASSLEKYLERFAITLSVMQDAEAIERIAWELVADHAEENVWYVEPRFCPLLNTRKGLRAEEALDAALRGLARAERDFGVRTGLIVCALRTLERRDSVWLAELAADRRATGVCGFDLAGAESGYPVSDHVEAFDCAADAGLPITIHAGEGYGPESIRQAIDLGHARRIGHGTRLHEDRALFEEVRAKGIPLEVCLTSNVQTGVVRSIAEHPAHRYHLAGVPVTLSTDNRLVSGVRLTEEYHVARDELGFSMADLTTVARAGFAHAFVDEDTRAELLGRFDQAVGRD